MANWTDIPNSNLEPGAPARSIDALALRDNPEAIAEAASGAPRIVFDAIRDGVAGESVGAVGTYAFLAIPNAANTSISIGGTRSGSGLRYASIDDAGAGLSIRYSGTPSGTWRLMGYILDNPNLIEAASLWLRIA